MSPFDNALAIDQIETAYTTLLARPVNKNNTRRPEFAERLRALAIDGVEHPRLVRSVLFAIDLPKHTVLIHFSLGGDHTIVLPILRSLHKVYGPISVIHFDS